MTERVRPREGPEVRIVDLRSQVPDGVLAIGREPAHLTWQAVAVRPELVQLAYEVQASATPGFETILATTGEVQRADQVAVLAPGGPMRSRETRFLRVRIATAIGWTAWSPILRVEAGLLHASDWLAQAVTVPHDPGAERQSPAPVSYTHLTLPTN